MTRLSEPTQNAAPSQHRDRAKRIHLALLVVGLGVLVWSGINPKEQFTWLMEVLPAIIGGAIFVGVYRRFRFTTLSYAAALVFAIVLMIGGHWTYAEVPIGRWVSDFFGASRNHYDRFGHFLQGAVPALITREVLLRTSPLRPGKWLFFLVAATCLAVSAGYELFEWGYAVTFGGEQADDFLGSQGDNWDAQADMGLALAGAILSQLALTRLQDRQLQRLQGRAA
jgi:putative membrane protein